MTQAHRGLTGGFFAYCDKYCRRQRPSALSFEHRFELVCRQLALTDRLALHWRGSCCGQFRSLWSLELTFAHRHLRSVSSALSAAWTRSDGLGDVPHRRPTSLVRLFRRLQTDSTPLLHSKVACELRGAAGVPSSDAVVHRRIGSSAVGGHGWPPFHCNSPLLQPFLCAAINADLINGMRREIFRCLLLPLAAPAKSSNAASVLKLLLGLSPR